jgi:hypothetical protein
MASIGLGVRALAAHGVVGRRVGAVEADLDVEVVHRSPGGGGGRRRCRCRWWRTSRRRRGDRVLDDLEEVGRIMGSPPPMFT